MAYPIDKVCEILGIPNFEHLGGSRRFDGASEEQIRRLVEIGGARLDACQNESPTLEALLAAPGRKTFGGYVIYPLRADARVTVDKAVASGLTDDEALQLEKQWSNADDLVSGDDHTRQVGAWWD